MPRRNSPVKSKGHKTAILARSSGAVDIQFHGAFGVDLMRAQNPELSDLAHHLGENGIAAFCPTTLSTNPDDLASAVARLGRWIRRSRTSPTFPKTSALPLGIHLEGPFINSACCGAHPPKLIRPLDLNELEVLWNLSQETLKVLTVAPETLSMTNLSHLVAWARERKISLSIGHSKATEEQALLAFNQGFRGITHTSECPSVPPTRSRTIGCGISVSSELRRNHYRPNPRRAFCDPVDRRTATRSSTLLCF